MSFPKYKKYKDSGVEWLGEVPEGWEVLPVKYVIDGIESGTSVNSLDEPAEDHEVGVNRLQKHHSVVVLEGRKRY